MESVGVSDYVSRIKRFNSPRYIRFKLCAFYIIIYITFLCLGAIINHFTGEKIPHIITDDIISFWLTASESKKTIDFISVIIYNSVDIFKISFIIIIAGFTFISGIISKITTAAWGLYNGFSLCYCAKFIIEHNMRLPVIAVAITIFLHGIVFINNCVRAELTAQKFSEYHNVNLLLTSTCFWKYIGWFLISFGYVLMICASYELILQILM